MLRWIAFFSGFLVCLLAASGCGGSGSASPDAKDEKAAGLVERVREETAKAEGQAESSEITPHLSVSECVEAWNDKDDDGHQEEFSVNFDGTSPDPFVEVSIYQGEPFGDTFGGAVSRSNVGVVRPGDCVIAPHREEGGTGSYMAMVRPGRWIFGGYIEGGSEDDEPIEAYLLTSDEEANAEAQLYEPGNGTRKVLLSFLGEAETGETRPESTESDGELAEELHAATEQGGVIEPGLEFEVEDIRVAVGGEIAAATLSSEDGLATATFSNLSGTWKLETLGSSGVGCELVEALREELELECVDPTEEGH